MKLNLRNDIIFWHYVVKFWLKWFYEIKHWKRQKYFGILKDKIWHLGFAKLTPFGQLLYISTSVWVLRISAFFVVFHNFL